MFVTEKYDFYWITTENTLSITTYLYLYSPLVSEESRHNSGLASMAPDQGKLQVPGVVTPPAASQSQPSAPRAVLEEVSVLFWIFSRHVEDGRGKCPAARQPHSVPSATTGAAFTGDMSAGGQATRSRDIPAVHRVAVHDSAHMPQEYSTTPGGTVFSTTPGGNHAPRKGLETNHTIQRQKGWD